MIVALLRNSKASLKVINYVAQILCLPYAIDMPCSIINDIDKVYVQVKLVPNLVYASKLLCSKKFKDNCESSADTPISLPKLNSIIRFNEAELNSLSGLYDLICYLVYSGETFLHQFCDALSILNLDEMFISFIVSVTLNESNASIRLASSICAIFCAILKQLPENAKLIESVIFNEQVSIESLLKHGNSLIRYRAVMLLRLLGRFCCYSLQNIWNTELNEILEVLICDSDEDVRNETANIIEEFKSFSFYL
jgi:fused-like protein